jgi:hypothetical protein
VKDKKGNMHDKVYVVLDKQTNKIKLLQDTALHKTQSPAQPGVKKVKPLQNQKKGGLKM